MVARTEKVACAQHCSGGPLLLTAILKFFILCKDPKRFRCIFDNAISVFKAMFKEAMSEGFHNFLVHEMNPLRSLF